MQYGKQNAQRAHCTSTVVLSLPCLYQVAAYPCMSASLPTSTKLAVPALMRDNTCLALIGRQLVSPRLISRSMCHLHVEITAISALNGLFFAQCLLSTAVFMFADGCLQEHFFEISE